MEHTLNLKLPYLMAAQSQKHTTHNEALRLLDGVVQVAVLDRDLSAPPVTPADGDRYLIAAGATGAWSGHDGELAFRADGAWMFAEPRSGWLVWVADEERLIVSDGENWATPISSLDMLGINATADTTNRLVVASESTLFDHAGNGHRHKINRATGADTASLLLQTGYSGRAEIGLTGDDDFHVKVSSDGVAWSEALVADSTGGAVRFPGGVEHATTLAPLAGLMFTPGGDGEISIFRLDASRAQHPRTATISSITGDTITLTSAVANVFFGTVMRDVSWVRIWNTSKTPAQSAWVKRDAATDQLQVTNVAHLAGWTNGETIQIGDPTSVTPLRSIAIDISPMLQARLGSVFPQRGLLMRGLAGASGPTSGAMTQLACSATATAGSFVALESATTGAVRNGMMVCPTSILSPVSAANLLFVRESDGGTGSVGMMGLWVQGVFA